MLFSRMATDGTSVDVTESLMNLYAGTESTACWIVGAGPSLLTAPVDLIERSPAPKIGVNLSGRGPDGHPPLLTPDIWTCYDPTIRFHRSIFLNPRTAKFIRSPRYRDLVPDTTFKVCDCPSTYLIKTSGGRRGYTDFLDPKAESILDCLDSFCQALDIGFRLGFRTFYCVGTDFITRPSDAQIQLARSRGVDYVDGEVLHLDRDQNPRRSDLLSHFIDACVKHWGGAERSVVIKELEAVDREGQYSFDERKPIISAVQSDAHYWRTVQYLRQSRRNMALNGVKLISCTPGSRLNAWFPQTTPEGAALTIRQQCGIPEAELNSGRYGRTFEQLAPKLPYHSDIPPYDWKNGKRPEVGPPPEVDIPPQAGVEIKGCGEAEAAADRMEAALHRFQAAADDVVIEEVH